MKTDLRWITPLALLSVATPQCIAAQYMTVQQARGLIFDQAVDFVAAPVELTTEQVDKLTQASGVKSRSPKQPVWKAMGPNGKFLGWFIIDQVIGKHELITYALGVTPEGTMKQFQVIEYREAWGSQVRLLAWRDQFVGKTSASLLRVGSDIENISGGTMSANSMTNGIKRLLFFHDLYLRGH